ncbi:MAG: hypothetical protein QXQ28_02060 [Candidatus Nezhaarchaeales archaeon]
MSKDKVKLVTPLGAETPLTAVKKAKTYLEALEAVQAELASLKGSVEALAKTLSGAAPETLEGVKQDLRGLVEGLKGEVVKLREELKTVKPGLRTTAEAKGLSELTGLTALSLEQRLTNLERTVSGLTAPLNELKAKALSAEQKLTSLEQALSGLVKPLDALTLKVLELDQRLRSSEQALNALLKLGSLTPEEVDKLVEAARRLPEAVELAEQKMRELGRLDVLRRMERIERRLKSMVKPEEVITPT